MIESHPDPLHLELYMLGGAFTDEERSALQRHVEQCASCRHLTDRISEFIATVDEQLSVVPAAAEQRLVAEISRTEGARIGPMYLTVHEELPAPGFHSLLLAARDHVPMPSFTLEQTLHAADGSIVLRVMRGHHTNGSFFQLHGTNPRTIHRVIVEFSGFDRLFITDDAGRVWIQSPDTLPSATGCRVRVPLFSIPLERSDPDEGADAITGVLRHESTEVLHWQKLDTSETCLVTRLTGGGDMRALIFESEAEATEIRLDQNMGHVPEDVWTRSTMIHVMCE